MTKAKGPALANALDSPESLLPLAEKAVEHARKAGAQFVDAAVSVSKGLSVAAEKSSIKTAEMNWSTHVSIRAYVAGGMGYASSSDVDAKEIPELAERAVALAKLATPDPEFVSLPLPETPEQMPDSYDPKILQIGPQDVIGWTCDNIRSAQSVRGDVLVSADAAVSASAAALAGSTGIHVARRGTNVYLGLFVIVKDGLNVGSFADHDSARFLDDFEPQGLGERVAQRALAYQNARKTKTRKTTLVLGPVASFSLICAMAEAANAESIQRHRSLFADRLGETVGATLWTITDNGLISRGLYSAPYDAEGAARKVVTILDRGRFVGALHNSYTAHKAKVPNTGHGQRTGGVSHSNLQITLGERPGRKLIEEVKDGVFLELGSLSPDLVSGDISTNLDFAFKIEDGELAYPLANAMVAGNLLDLLNHVDAVSSDCRCEPGNVMPTLRVRDVQIASEGD